MNAPFPLARVTCRQIQEAVAAEFKIPLIEMVSARRERKIAHVRQYAMYLTKELTALSFPEIGRRFGNRDHTTIMYGVEKALERMLADTELSGCIEALQERLRAEARVTPLSFFVRAPKPAEPIVRAPVFVLREEPKVQAQRDRIKRSSPGPNPEHMTKVYRDPCFKCGARADIGCVHTRAMA